MNEMYNLGFAMFSHFSLVSSHSRIFETTLLVIIYLSAVDTISWLTRTFGPQNLRCLSPSQRFSSGTAGLPRFASNWPLKQTQAGYPICGIILSEILTSKSINSKSQNIITLPEARMNGKHYKYRVRINVAKQICRKFVEDSRRHL